MVGGKGSRNHFENAALIRAQGRSRKTLLIIAKKVNVSLTNTPKLLVGSRGCLAPTKKEIGGQSSNDYFNATAVSWITHIKLEFIKEELVLLLFVLSKCSHMSK